MDSIKTTMRKTDGEWIVRLWVQGAIVATYHTNDKADASATRLHMEEEGKTQGYEYYINLDERGEFYADVRTPTGKTVFEVKGFEIFEDGFMKHKNDIEGLREYLASLSIIPSKGRLTKAN